MTPKEKAIELVNKFYVYCNNNHKRDDYAVKCALIAVDEILKNGLLVTQSNINKANKIKPNIDCKEFWKKVKQEILKL